MHDWSVIMPLNIKKRSVTDGQTSRVHIPYMAWMRIRLRGSYKYAQNFLPIVWAYLPPPKGETVYCVNWRGSQQNLQASHTYVQE